MHKITLLLFAIFLVIMVFCTSIVFASGVQEKSPDISMEQVIRLFAYKHKIAAIKEAIEKRKITPENGMSMIDDFLTQSRVIFGQPIKSDSLMAIINGIEDQGNRK